jgi:branched-chain amino acid transport system ATP-binding protein
LSGGQKKLLELGRAIVKSPRVLLLDEPLAGVNPKLSEQILEIIDNLIIEGKTVLMVEHNIEAVMRVSARVVVMAQGEIIADGSPNEIRADEKVIDAYLGSTNE